jgi:phosphatidylinositol-3-phosphatase
MSRPQLAVLAALSLLATVLVLVAGGRPRPLGPLPAGLRASAPVVRAALPAGGGEAGEDAGSSGAADGSGAGEPTAEAPADEAAADNGAAAGDGAAGSEEDGQGSGGDGSGDDGSGDARSGSDSGDGGSRTATGDGPGSTPRPTKVRHVFVIALQGRGFDAAFGTGAGAAAPYLTGRLRPKGVLLSGYRSLANAELPDHLALVGGQPPNAETRANCPVFKEIPPSAAPAKDGTIAAAGCVYPNTVVTLGDQLTASRRSWRAYAEDLDRGQPRRTACRRPDSNAADDTLKGRPGDGYATRRNPFVYFHSLLDLGGCDADDGPLERLARDLRAARTTPSFSWIAPNLCNAGSEAPCADGSPGGLPAADAFLATWVPRILASPAYRAGGLLLVVFAGRAGTTGTAGTAGTTSATRTTGGTDTAGATGATDDAAGTAAGAGGETAGAGAPPRNGALLLSPFARAGTTAASAYDPYALLRSIEDLFALRPLGRAATAPSFAPTILAKAYAEPPGDG